MRCFEVDIESTQRLKRDMLVESNVAHAGITYVSVDFEVEDENDDWMSRLIHSGFDVDAPTVVIWEGVTFYLSHEAIDRCVKRLKVCRDCTVVCDVISEEAVLKDGDETGNTFGEPLITGFAEGKEGDLFERNGIKVACVWSAKGLEDLFVPKTADGRSIDKYKSIREIGASMVIGKIGDA